MGLTPQVLTSDFLTLGQTIGSPLMGSRRGDQDTFRGKLRIPPVVKTPPLSRRSKQQSTFLSLLFPSLSFSFSSFLDSTSLPLFSTTTLCLFPHSSRSVFLFFLSSSFFSSSLPSVSPSKQNFLIFHYWFNSSGPDTTVCLRVPHPSGLPYTPLGPGTE